MARTAESWTCEECEALISDYAAAILEKARLQKEEADALLWDETELRTVQIRLDTAATRCDVARFAIDYHMASSHGHASAARGLGMMPPFGQGNRSELAVSQEAAC